MRPRGFDENEALEKAMEVFWTRGYEGTSMSDLEEHLGLGRQSIYNALGDKRALFVKAVALYSSRNAARIEDALLHGKRGLDDLRAYLHGVVDFLTSCKPRRSCLVINTMIEGATDDKEIGTACRADQQRLQRAVRAAVERASAAGELKKGADVDALTTLFLGQMYGLNVMAKAKATGEQLHAAVDALLDSFA